MELIVDIKKHLGDFTLESRFSAGEGVTGLLGASGCGKSLTLKCIAGVERPDEGHIELDGRVLFDSAKGVDLPPQKRQVGYLFQNYALFPNMTVEQNIAAGAADRKNRREEARHLAETFGLTPCLERYPRQISGGQQQRTALARILASRPRALLLDEPFSALDSYLKWQIEMDLMSRLDRFGGPVLLVTHSRDEVFRQCCRVCVMERGRSQPMQSAEQLLRAPQTLSAARLSGCENLTPVRLGEDGSLLVTDWGLALRQTGPLPEKTAYLGVRAGQLRLADGPGEDCFLCRVLRRVAGQKADILLLRPTGAAADAVSLRMEVPTGTERGVEAGTEVWACLPAQCRLFLRAE